MNKKVFLSVLLIPFVLSTATGCGSHNNGNNEEEIKEYADNSQSLNTTTIGEATINNISKYTAIGVGKLDKKSSNKRYRLIANQKNDDNSEETGEEIEKDDGTVDLSNTLVGLTTEGILEELSLTIQNGQQLNSSTFTITYYEEIGDFVLVSVLPMNVDDYIASISDWRVWEWNEWNEEKHCDVLVDEIRHVDVVTACIGKLAYPLKYSIRYLDNDSSEYKYIDTSYLIHKRSGKLFPFSSRQFCVDAQKCRYGEFINATVYVDDESIISYPINSVVYRCSEEETRADNIEYNRETRVIKADFNGFSFFPNRMYQDRWDCYYEENMNNTFKNGFYMFEPELTNDNPDNPLDSWWNHDNPYLKILLFNEETSSLEISSMQFRIRGQEYNVVSAPCIKFDKYGNFLCVYKGRTMYYNIYSKQFGRVNNGLDIANNWWNDEEINNHFDDWTQQFFYETTVETTVHAGWSEYKNYTIFLNENTEEDYRFETSDLDYSDDRQYPVGNLFRDRRTLFERCVRLSDKKIASFINDKIYVISLDADGHYSKDMSCTCVYEVPNTFIHFDKDALYYRNDLVIHKVVFSDDYQNYNDSVFVSLEQYPFIESIVYLDNGLICFDGMDNQLNTLTGYVYPDGTISFEIEEFNVDSQTSTLSPIN